MILPLALLLEYWFEHVTIGLVCVKFVLLTSILYKGVQGFTNDCLCGFWLPWINDLSPVCLSIFGKSSRNNSWSVSLT